LRKGRQVFLGKRRKGEQGREGRKGARGGRGHIEMSMCTLNPFFYTHNWIFPSVSSISNLGEEAGKEMGRRRRRGFHTDMSRHTDTHFFT
jgi:hypothetical protein